MSDDQSNALDSASDRSSVAKVKTNRLDDRYVTYKVHQLDWFDVESRIKYICNEMIRPVADIATTAKTTAEKDNIRLEQTMIDTEKLNNAVFYKARKAGA